MRKKIEDFSPYFFCVAGGSLVDYFRVSGCLEFWPGDKKYIFIYIYDKLITGLLVL